jgi:hypothetical protein
MSNPGCVITYPDGFVLALADGFVKEMVGPWYPEIVDKLINRIEPTEAEKDILRGLFTPPKRS